MYWKRVEKTRVLEMRLEGKNPGQFYVSISYMNKTFELEMKRHAKNKNELNLELWKKEFENIMQNPLRMVLISNPNDKIKLKILI